MQPAELVDLFFNLSFGRPRQLIWRWHDCPFAKVLDFLDADRWLRDQLGLMQQKSLAIAFLAVKLRRGFPLTSEFER